MPRAILILSNSGKQILKPPMILMGKEATTEDEFKDLFKDKSLSIL